MEDFYTPIQTPLGCHLSNWIRHAHKTTKWSCDIILTTQWLRQWYSSKRRGATGQRCRGAWILTCSRGFTRQTRRTRGRSGRPWRLLLGLENSENRSHLCKHISFLKFRHFLWLYFLLTMNSISPSLSSLPPFLPASLPLPPFSLPPSLSFSLSLPSLPFSLPPSLSFSLPPPPPSLLPFLSHSLCLPFQPATFLSTHTHTQ